MLFFLVILSSLSFSDSYSGYLRINDVSFCIDECSEYFLESETGDFLVNVTTPVDWTVDHSPLSYYLDRYVVVEGETEFSCVECTALILSSIFLSQDCDYPVACFADPCEVSEECQLNTPVDCVSNYCGGCYADYYDLNGYLVDCYLPGLCDDISGVYFGECDMFLGYALSNGLCEGVSGCGWESGGIDYTNIFFTTYEECELSCLDNIYTCEDIQNEYEQLHTEEFAMCELDNDCISVWGHCDIGLGGCHYSVNEELYPEDLINQLVYDWTYSESCEGGVCDCMDLPYAQCLGGECISVYCNDDNPAGCIQTGCEDGNICVDILEYCVPSHCFCDDSSFYGYWYCTEDCGGGTCVLKGDLSLDDSVNIVDVVQTVNLILNGGYDMIVDMNNDNSINISDIIILINIILGE